MSKTLDGVYSDGQLMDVAMERGSGFASLQSARWEDEGLRVFGTITGNRSASLLIPTTEAVARLDALRAHENAMRAANG